MITKMDNSEFCLHMGKISEYEEFLNENFEILNKFRNYFIEIVRGKWETSLLIIYLNELKSKGLLSFFSPYGLFHH